MISTNLKRILSILLTIFITRHSINGYCFAVYDQREMSLNIDVFLSQTMAVPPGSFTNGRSWASVMAAKNNGKLAKISVNRDPNTNPQDIGLAVRNALRDWSDEAVFRLHDRVYGYGSENARLQSLRDTIDAFELSAMHAFREIRRNARNALFYFAAKNPALVVGRDENGEQLTVLEYICLKTLLWNTLPWTNAGEIEQNFKNLWPEDEFQANEPRTQRLRMDKGRGIIRNILPIGVVAGQAGTLLTFFQRMENKFKNIDDGFYLNACKNFFSLLLNQLSRFNEAHEGKLDSMGKQTFIAAALEENGWKKNNDTRTAVELTGMLHVRHIVALCRDYRSWDLGMFLTQLLALESDAQERAKILHMIVTAHHLNTTLAYHRISWAKLSLGQQVQLIDGNLMDRVQFLSSLEGLSIDILWPDVLLRDLQNLAQNVADDLALLSPLLAPTPPIVGTRGKIRSRTLAAA